MRQGLVLTPDQLTQSIRTIVHRYARLMKSGRPVQCTPGIGHIWQGDDHSAGKVIYDTADSAASAARQLRILTGQRFWSYPCNRSRRGHLHLTTKRPK